MDFILLKQDAENPHVKLVSDLWNSGMHDIRELVKSTKIRRGRIHSILTRAKELNLEDSLFDLKVLADYFENLYTDFDKEKLIKAQYEETNETLCMDCMHGNRYDWLTEL